MRAAVRRFFFSWPQVQLLERQHPCAAAVREGSVLHPDAQATPGISSLAT